MASRLSFDMRVGTPLFLIWLATMLVWSGCATVRPEEREHLAEPGMTFGSDSIAEQHEEHMLTNRESSTGATGVVGGGCGCN